MRNWIAQASGWFFRLITALFDGPQRLAFLPAISLAAYLIGGEGWLILVALAIPLVVAIGLRPKAHDRLIPPDSPVESLALIELSDSTLARARRRGRVTACLAIHIDGIAAVNNQGDRAEVMTRLMQRVRSVLRNGDLAVWAADGGLRLFLAPQPMLNGDHLLSLAKRVQAAIEEPMAIAERPRAFSAAFGMALSTQLRSAASGADLLEAAMLSLAEAQSSGASALRLAPAGIVQPAKGSSLTVAAALNALNSGEVRPWFQPQLSTDTGRVSGVEALARWVHPKRGLIPPGEFLGLIESAGAMERLGDVILTDSLTALADWDSQGLHVPGVSVNLSDAELRNPHLADKILWELDRHNMPSHRLRVEVLETVVLTGPNQIASLNLDKLAKAGCRVDLDDFGTGNASIAALQKLNIACLKIDRSFVSRLDRDENQRRLVSAILSMAERLGVETLAEGVESAGEHSLLAQLGCDHVQGFGIARPMAADQLATWVREHDAKPGQARWPSQDAG